jgi:hypothetical protein
MAAKGGSHDYGSCHVQASDRNDAEAVDQQLFPTAPKWRENPDLVRKNYLYDGTNGLGGGVYLERYSGCEKWHDDRWRYGVIERYGSEPNITYFEQQLS